MTSFSHISFRTSWLSRIAIALLLLASSAAAQLTTPLHVGNTNAIYNEFGDILPGNNAEPGALVMLLWASNSVIYPPAIDGQADPGNPIVSNGVTAIGRSMAPWLQQSGRFSLTLASPRPASGKVFVRVFNKPTLAESSFYADSQIFTISGNQEFFADVGPTTNALDSADDDDDGLNNAWEKSYGSDLNNPDSDGDGVEDGVEHTMGLHPARADSDRDGMADGHELRAGTDPTDPSSFLGVAGLVRQGNHLFVQWRSTAGHFYQIEAAHELLSGVYESLSGIIPAETGAQTSAVLTNALNGAQPLILRIRLVEE